MTIIIAGTRLVMPDSSQFRDAMTNSARLLQEDDYAGALRVVDNALAQAVGVGASRWVKILCHHAAIISEFNGDVELAKRYYEQSLAVNPENLRAFYGLARLSREQGAAEAAKQYAARCYRALMRNDDDMLSQGWLELLLKNWPELASGE